MAITDEVRQLARRRSFTAEELLDIADRIDEEHKKAMDDSYRDGYQEGKRDGDDEWYEEHESYLEEHGWYQALDADKEPIHIGDVMVDRGFPDAKYTVVGIGKDEFFTRDAYGELHEHIASLYPHHKQPTVEDLLREMHAKLDEVTALYVGEAIDSDERDSDEARIFAEYAAKLRMAGDTE